MFATSKFEYLQKLLAKEIATLNAKITHYDDLSFKIKGWAVTLWSAIVIYGSIEHRQEIAAMGILIGLIFWSLDAYFITFQRRIIVRLRAIEDFLNEDGKYFNITLKETFQLKSFGDFPVHDLIGRLGKRKSEKFMERFNEDTLFWRCFKLPHVSLIYIGLILGAIAIIIGLGLPIL